MRHRDDASYMELACRLALRGRGSARPNPMVGAVLVKDGVIIGTGYHKRAGEAHAEVVAIDHAEANPEGATLYVNLEPCCHYGRTPPCTEYLLSKKIQRVVIGTIDPNPLVNGKSVEYLRANGVEVNCGVLEERCKKVNEVFFKYIRTGRPFVVLKAAMTLDGKISSSAHASRWISSEHSRHRVHKLRNSVDAVMVGIGTVLADDPLLTVRGLKRSQNPVRVVLDSRLRVPVEAQVVKTIGQARTVVATTEHAPPEQIELLRDKGVEILVFEADARGRVPMDAVLTQLGKQGVQSVLIEGGSEVFTDAIEYGHVDKLIVYIAPLLLGGAAAPSFFEGKGIEHPSQAIRITAIEVRRSGPDICVEGYLQQNCSLVGHEGINECLPG